jgi:hypothetical protein
LLYKMFLAGTRIAKPHARGFEELVDLGVDKARFPSE